MTDENTNIKDTSYDKIIPLPIEIEMKKSYIDYAMSVIVGRALPDARDGLKPVHRRILFSMNELGLSYNRPYKKSARVVGDVLGKYHPHGESAIYDSLVRMAQDFSLRYPLVQGQGNFGSVDGDSPAAMRYTECRMRSITHDMIEDIDKETVAFVENFDGSEKEPTVLPGKVPNLLVNGSSGIAVGMSTNIPPHNMEEIADGIVKIIDNPDTTDEELIDIVKGPDFPTGGIIYGSQGIRSYITSGRGKVRVRAKTHFEEMDSGKTRIIVDEIPYQVNKTPLIEGIVSLVKEKKIDGITELRDESDREGMRVVIELRRDVVPEVILNQLFAHTMLQTTFGIIMLALVNNQPVVLPMKKAMEQYISHRFDVIRKRSAFLLQKAKDRAHILEGLLIALDNLDDVIRVIRKSKSAEEASGGLQNGFLLSEEQAKAILNMRLQKLTGMEIDGIRTEHLDVKKTIEDLEDILERDQRVYDIIKADLLEIRSKYGD
ncbi:MAG TPA: DNA topoisomerase 4 subunit A, partial [Euryarchaeota archaeon]|nr:DNA topoisomerase 4 subunit A [Euryarchaeota archaeon]